MQRNTITGLALCAGVALVSLGNCQVRAEEAPKPLVSVFGVSGGKAAYSNVTQPDVKLPLTVENTSTQTLADVSLDLNQFVAPTGDVVSGSIEPAKVPKLLPGATAQFTLTVRFLPAATFSAHARVLQGKKMLISFDIEIVRTRGKPQIDIGDVAAIQETASVPRAELDIPLAMKIYATGASAVVTRPVLHSVTRKAKVDSTTGTAAVAKLDTSALPDPLVVTAGQPSDITLRLKGITAPGRYDLKLRFAPSGYDIVEKDVTIYVRDPGWIAAVLIFLGVVQSLVFQSYSGTIRPRLLLQRRIESIFEEMHKLATTAAENDTRELAREVNRALARRSDQARDQGGLPAATVDLYELLLPGLQRWSEMRHLVAATRPEAVRQRLLATLQTAAGAFVAASPDAATITASLNTLQSFPNTIRDETAKELKTQLDALDTQLRTDARPAAARLRSALLLVRQKAANGDLNAAVGAFDAARLQYAVLLADDLMKRVDSTIPPIGFTSGDWASLAEETKLAAAEVQKSNDADSAVSKITIAMKDYLFRVAAALRTAAAALGSPEKAKAVTDELDAVETATSGDHLTEAWQHMNTATAAFQKASVPVGRQMGSAERTASDLLGVTGSGPVGGSALNFMDAFALPSAADLARPGAAARTIRRLHQFDILTSAFALILATAIGLQALWIDNPVWGGGALYLAAFVWGFAVDQLTHAGIVALRPR